MVYCKSYVAIKGLSVPTFLEHGGPVHFDNRLVGILILLAVTHGEYQPVPGLQLLLLSHNGLLLKFVMLVLWPTKSYHILTVETMGA